MEQEEILGSDKEEIRNNIKNIFCQTIRLKENEVQKTIEYNECKNKIKIEQENLIKAIEEYKNKPEEYKKTNIENIITNINMTKEMQDFLYTKEAYKQGFKTCLEILFELDIF